MVNFLSRPCWWAAAQPASRPRTGRPEDERLELMSTDGLGEDDEISGTSHPSGMRQDQIAQLRRRCIGPLLLLVARPRDGKLAPFLTIICFVKGIYAFLTAFIGGGIAASGRSTSLTTARRARVTAVYRALNRLLTLLA